MTENELLIFYESVTSKGYIATQVSLSVLEETGGQMVNLE